MVCFPRWHLVIHCRLALAQNAQSLLRGGMGTALGSRATPYPLGMAEHGRGSELGCPCRSHSTPLESSLARKHNQSIPRALQGQGKQQLVLASPQGCNQRAANISSRFPGENLELFLP